VCFRRVAPIDRASRIAYNVAMPEPSLDTAEIYGRLDPHGLLGRIEGLPEQVAGAWAAARALELPALYRGATEIVVLGMGGSGIGGALLQALAVDLGARAPVRVVRGYRLSASVSEQALVLASSNSGDTEETVEAFGQALERGARCVAIATGGRMAAMARAAGAPLLSFKWAGEPRSALGWSFASLLAICGKLGLLPDLDSELPSALDQMRALGLRIGRDAPETANVAKQLARRLTGRLPVFIGAEAMAPVAYRWRTQVNENGKSWAIADELPEMNHNAPVGYGLPRRVVPLLHVVLLRHAAVHPRIALRIDATRDQMSRAGIDAEIVEVAGDTLLAQMLCGLILGDYTSYYLGLLNGVDPSPVEPLIELKSYLSSRA
jgi:glucose/mannose-6-phosphate isomerase